MARAAHTQIQMALWSLPAARRTTVRVRTAFNRGSGKLRPRRGRHARECVRYLECACGALVGLFDETANFGGLDRGVRAPT